MTVKSLRTTAVDPAAIVLLRFCPISSFTGNFPGAWGLHLIGIQWSKLLRKPLTTVWNYSLGRPTVPAQLAPPPSCNLSKLQLCVNDEAGSCLAVKHNSPPSLCGPPCATTDLYCVRINLGCTFADAVQRTAKAD